MSDRYVSSYWARGISFRGIPTGSIKYSDPVDHLPEPDNKYDSNAIKLMSGDTHIGYLPHELCAPYSAGNFDVTGYVHEVKQENGVITGINVIIGGDVYLPKQGNVRG